MKTRADKIRDAKATGLVFPFPDPPVRGDALEVAPGILWLRLPLPMALDHVNVYAMEDGEGDAEGDAQGDAQGWMLVDTGMDTPPAREAWEVALSGPLAGRPITRILVTHYHPDHIGLAGWLAEKTGAPLVTTRTSFFAAKALQLDQWDEPPAEAVAFYRAAGYGEAEIEALRARAKFGFARVCSPLPVGFRRIAAGDTLRIGRRDWEILTGHGHAAEHAVLWCKADGLVLAGDQVLPRITSNIGVYPTEPEGDPLGEFLHSCATLRDALPDNVLALPGHNEPFTGLGIRCGQLIAHHAQSLDALQASLSKPRTALECFDVLFDREITDGLRGFAIVEAVAHLNHLRNSGRAKRNTTDGVHRYEAI